MLERRRLYCRSGLPAGSSYADLAVMAYCVLDYDQLCSKWPRMELHIYVDDQLVSATGPQGTVEDQVVGATLETASMPASPQRSMAMWPAAWRWRNGWQPALHTRAPRLQAYHVRTWVWTSPWAESEAAHAETIGGAAG